MVHEKKPSAPKPAKTDRDKEQQEELDGTKDPDGQEEPDRQKGNKDESTDPVLYHQIVCLPFRIREFGGKDRPKDLSPLDCWVGHIKDREAKWNEDDNFMPFHAPEIDQNEDGRSENGAKARLRYAEYAYFHPFVRAFLYPTVEDRFQGRKDTTDSTKNADTTSQDIRPLYADVRNRSLRVLTRSDIRWAKISVLDRHEIEKKKVDGTASHRFQRKEYTLRVRRVELHLFETRIGFLVVEFDNELGRHRPAMNWSDDEYDGAEPSSATRPFDVARGTASDWGGSQDGAQQRELKLSDVLLLQDALRRAYVPYWEFEPVVLRDDLNNPLNCIAGHVVQNIEWLNENGEVIFKSDPSWPAEFRKRIQETRETGLPPLFPWWSHLMAPLQHLDGKIDTSLKGAIPSKQNRSADTDWSPEEVWLNEILDPEGKANADIDYRVCYREFGDDRLPCMTYMGTKKPWDITDGDWMRLAFADEPGEPNDLSYSPWLFSGSRDSWTDRTKGDELKTDAYREFCKRHALDRFFVKIPDGISFENGPTYQKSLSTRYLISGMVFAAVGCSDKAAGREVMFDPHGDIFQVRPFGVDPVSGLLGHFRHHYFKLGLVALFHRFSLLNFEEELSIAVSEELGKRNTEVADPNFRRLVVRVRKEMIKFRLRFWFSEVTSQQQGQEIFSLWSEQLHTQQLFDAVNQQVDEAEQLLDRWDSSERQKAEELKRGYLKAFGTVAIVLAFLSFFKDALNPNDIMRVASGYATVAAILFILAWQSWSFNSIKKWWSRLIKNWSFKSIKDWLLKRMKSHGMRLVFFISFLGLVIWALTQGDSKKKEGGQPPPDKNSKTSAPASADQRPVNPGNKTSSAKSQSGGNMQQKSHEAVPARKPLEDRKIPVTPKTSDSPQNKGGNLKKTGGGAMPDPARTPKP